MRFRTRGRRTASSSRSGGGYTKTYTPGAYIPPQPARQGPNKTLLPPTPASRGPSSTTFTPNPTEYDYDSESEPSTSFKIPVTVTFVTGASLVVVNNIKNGKLTQVWDMIYNGKPIENPKVVLGTIGGELSFVMVLSFFAEINGSTSGVVFALFIGLWMVWAINNADTLVSWTNNVRQTAQVPANSIVQNASKK